MLSRKRVSALALAFALSLGLAISGPCAVYAQENPQKENVKRVGKARFAFTNWAWFFANDFHAVFTGTGGTLHKPRMTKGPKNAVITAKGNEVDIVFPTPVPSGGQIGFTVRSRFMPIQFYYGYWTWNGWPLFPPAFPNAR